MLDYDSVMQQFISVFILISIKQLIGRINHPNTCIDKTKQRYKTNKPNNETIPYLTPHLIEALGVG